MQFAEVTASLRRYAGGGVMTNMSFHGFGAIGVVLRGIEISLNSISSTGNVTHGFLIDTGTSQMSGHPITGLMRTN